MSHDPILDRAHNDPIYADIGEWEKGKMVKLSANTLRDALREASDLLPNFKKERPDIEDPFVVQIYCMKRNNRPGKMLWDYMNRGFK